jgi:hypothetical protein
MRCNQSVLVAHDLPDSGRVPCLGAPPCFGKPGDSRTGGPPAPSAHRSAWGADGQNGLTAHHARDHHNLLGLGVERVDADGSATLLDRERRRSSRPLLLKDPLCFCDGCLRFRIPEYGQAHVPCGMIVTTSRQHSKHSHVSTP